MSYKIAALKCVILLPLTKRVSCKWQFGADMHYDVTIAMQRWPPGSRHATKKSSVLNCTVVSPIEVLRRRKPPYGHTCLSLKQVCE